MSIDFNFLLDRVYVLASVRGHHLESAKDLYNYHIKFENKHFIEVNTKEELIGALEQIESEVNKSSGPIIHIEAHGLQSDDLLALSKGIELSNGEQVYWDEIRSNLTQINAKCENNLIMVMATCWGMYILQDLIKAFFDDVIGAKCPFLLFVGPEKSASVDDFIDAFPAFYKELFESKNIIKAVHKMNEKSSVKFRCDNAWAAFFQCIQSFTDKQIKNRIQNIANNPDVLNNYYCALYEYTYDATCDMSAVERIMADESFYVDYLNKRKGEFLHIADDGLDRFPVIDKIENFNMTLPIIRKR